MISEEGLRAFLSLILVCGIGTVFMVKCQTDYSGENQAIAERQAKAFAKTLGENLETTKVICAGGDSDWDGYVSCTIKPEGKEPYGVECDAAYTVKGSGCRLQFYGKGRQ